MEFKRLCEKLNVQASEKGESRDERAGEVSKALGGITIVQKGATDVIAVDTTGPSADPGESKVDASDKEKVAERIEVDTEGGYKRCGGQGDILSGSIGTMLAWGKCYEEGTYGFVILLVAQISVPKLMVICIGTRRSRPPRSLLSQRLAVASSHAPQAVLHSRSRGVHWSRRTCFPSLEARLPRCLGRMGNLAIEESCDHRTLC